MSDPSQPVHSAPLFALALALAPENGRDWLNDMRLELPFLPGPAARLRWGLAALGLALSWRAAQIARPSPGTRTALASLLTAALVAVLVVIPSGDVLGGASDVTAFKAVPADTEASSEPYAARFGQSSADAAEADALPNANDRAGLAAPSAAPAAPVSPLSEPEAETARAPSPSEAASPTLSETASANLQDLTVTPVAGNTVTLRAVSAVSVRIEQTGETSERRLGAGERLELALPVTISSPAPDALRFGDDSTPLPADSVRFVSDDH